MTTPALADPYISLVNPYGGEYVPETWVPLRLNLSNDTNNELQGTVEADLPNGEGKINYRVAVNVPANSRFRTSIYAPLAAVDQAGKKKDETNTVGIVVWKRDGADLAQTDLLLRPNSDSGDVSPRRSTLIYFVGATYDETEMHDYSALAPILTEVSGTRVASWGGSIETMAIHPVAYDSCRFVGLGGIELNNVDAAQRTALLSWVRSGGTLLVSAPVGVADPRGTWLAPYLPVRTVGQRLTDHLTTSAGPMALKGSVNVSEAVLANGGVQLIGDAHYVHAAYKTVGLGRVVFTSFPPDSVKQDTERSRQMWTQLLDLTAVDPSWASTQLPEKSSEFLREMIGSPAPPRTIAVGLAAGFVGLVLVLHLVWRGAQRPRAFAAVAVLAIVGSVALIGLGFASQKREPLTAGRVALMKLSENGGYIQEAVAFTGSELDLSLGLDSPVATLRPLAFDADVQPTLSVNPFAAPNAGAAPKRIDRVWQADSAAPSGFAASASGVFDASGLKLTVTNETGGTLIAPVLIYGPSVYRLPAIAGGSNQVTATGEARNTPGAPAATGQVDANQVAANDRLRSQKYLNGGPILTEQDQLRAAMLAATFGRSAASSPGVNLTNADPVEPRIAGWMESSTPLIKPSVEPAVQRSLVLALLPVTIGPSTPGSTVTIDRGFNTLVSGQTAIPVYDTGSGTWLPSSQPGSWQIGFRPPRQIGKLSPTRVTIHGNVSLPAHTMTIGHGIVQDGKPDFSTGETVVTWANTFGPQPTISFDVTPTDYDENGTIWLSLNLEMPQATGGVQPLWSITELGVDIEARVE